LWLFFIIIFFSPASLLKKREKGKGKRKRDKGKGKGERKREREDGEPEKEWARRREVQLHWSIPMKKRKKKLCIKKGTLHNLKY